ncbi:MAG: SDR family oxidoreductase [Longimicrobiales bacterium]
MRRYDEIRAQLREAPQRWLITGVAGFIGSHLLETLLDLDQHVVGLDNFATGYRRNIEDVLARTNQTAGTFRLIEADIRDADACLAACQEMDVVLHEAALGSVPRSIVDPALYHHVNIDGTVNMMMAAREAGIERFVYASSSAVYGDSEELPKHEARIGQAVSPYGLTKRVGEEYAAMLHRVYGLEAVGLRYFNVFGRRQEPRSQYAAVIPGWIRKLLRGESCEIFGDGETTRDFCYIDNVVQANLLASTVALEGDDQVYNVGCGERTTLNELFATIRDRLAWLMPQLAPAAPVHGTFRPGDIRHSQADITKIRTRLDYEPTHLLGEGIAETLEWYVELFRPKSERATA